jgi:hypothetical protein
MLTLPRILTTVPQLLHVHLEIAKAIYTLRVPINDGRAGRAPHEPLTEDGISELVAQIARDIVRDLRKTGYMKGKTWEERYAFGLYVLRKFGVLAR